MLRLHPYFKDNVVVENICQMIIHLTIWLKCVCLNKRLLYYLILKFDEHNCSLVQWLTLILTKACQHSSCELKRWAIQHGGCVFVQHKVLGFWNKLCITHVFYLQLISLICGRGLFANGVVGAMRAEERIGSWWLSVTGSCSSTVSPPLSRRGLIVNGRPLGCGNTPSGP